MLLFVEMGNELWREAISLAKRFAAVPLAPVGKEVLNKVSK